MIAKDRAIQALALRESTIKTIDGIEGALRVYRALLDTLNEDVYIEEELVAVLREIDLSLEAIRSMLAQGRYNLSIAGKECERIESLAMKAFWEANPGKNFTELSYDDRDVWVQNAKQKEAYKY